MSDNNKKAYYEIAFCAYLLLNGMAAGHFIGDMRWMFTHGFNPAVGLDAALTMLAFHITAKRGIYWYRKKNEQQK